MIIYKPFITLVKGLINSSMDFLYTCTGNLGNQHFIREMMQGEIHILPTDKTPEFLFSTDGMLNIRGRGLYKNRTQETEQIVNWIDEYLLNPAEITYVTIAFEYLNSFITTVLVTILRKLSQVILMSGKLVIHWYYEEDDEDILERGEYISSTFNIPIEFILTHSD
jgi:hypothetical protein